jgi:hypothetical protein
VIREIAWRLREIGNDGRICDLIDSQVQVIEQGAEQISSDEAKAALEAAFAALAGRIAEFSDDEMPAAVAEAPMAEAPVAEAPVAEAASVEVPVATPSPVAQDEPAVVAAEAFDMAPAQDEAPALHAEAAFAEMEAAAIETLEVVELTAEAADAHDEALLDMIAMEMGAPDPIDDDEIAEIVELVLEQAQLVEPMIEQAQFAEPPAIEPEAVAELPEPVAAPIELQVQPPLPPVAEAAPEPVLEVSLGSSIIASGLVRKPVAANDPLAPIRRMSQAEKIAFFS